MKVYIAAPWGNKADARAARILVQQAGHRVTSRWMDQPDGDYEQPAEKMAEEALRDIDDTYAANVLLYLNLAKSEGKAVELGMFLARQEESGGVKIVVVGGKANNVFLHLPSIIHVSSVEEALGQIN
jgi:hypothetical protein